jgi:hypothetical protein
MTAKKEETAIQMKSKGIEGFVLIVAGIIVVLTKALRYIPEVGRILFGSLSIYLLLDMFLKIAIIIVIVKYFDYLAYLFNSYLLTSSNTKKTELGGELIKAILRFILLIVFYWLIMPSLKAVIMMTGMIEPWVITLINVAVILVGIKLLAQIWEKTKIFIHLEEEK